MYWNDTTSHVLDISTVGGYVKHPHMKPTINEGYNCDTLQPTKVLFMGSCDLDGPISDTNKSWARLLHMHLMHSMGPVPYIALAKMSAGFVSFPRRLFTFCEKYGAPEYLYMVVPRPVAIEIPLSNGQIVSVSNRIGFPNWLQRHNVINEQEYSLLHAASTFCDSQLDNYNYQLYQFEQSASFIKLLCQQYNIKFKWTINLSSSAIPYYAKRLLPFLEHCQYMKSTFIGVARSMDFGFDGSMGDESQYQISNLFINAGSVDFDDVVFTLNRNVDFALTRTNATQRAV